MNDYSTPDECMRKADQEWEMAGLARQDGDKADEKLHIERAQEWEKRAKELLQ